MTHSVKNILSTIWEISIINDNELNIISVPEIKQDLSSGIYTSIKIFPGNKVYQFHHHIERLIQSAQLSGFSFKCPEKLIRDSIRSLLNKLQLSNVKVQIMVFPESAGSAIYLLFSPLPILPEGGAKAITNKTWRNNPKAKRTDFILLSTDAKKKLQKDVNEILMVNEKGEILEGMSSNFFGYAKGVIWTAEEGVLSGTTRDSVLKIIQELNIDICLASYSLDNLKELNEAFITSVSRGVLPVVRINEKQIGDGKPGKTTLLIKNKFDELITNDLEEL